MPYGGLDDGVSIDGVPRFAFVQAMGLGTEFQKEFKTKFMNGQREHGNNLFNDFSLREITEHAKEEVLDQWSYVKAIEKLLEEVAELLQEALDADLIDDVQCYVRDALETIYG